MRRVQEGIVRKGNNISPCTAALLSTISHYRRSRSSLLKANARDGLLNEISARGRDVPSALLLFSDNDNERDFTLRGALPDTALPSLARATRSFVRSIL